MPIPETQMTGAAASVLAWQPEDELIRSAQEGDAAAFEELIRQYQGGVQMQCARRGLSRDDVSDVQQDVFIKVLRNLQNYRHDTAFKTWLYRVTENCIFDHFRRRTRYALKHEPIPTDDQDRPVEFPTCDADADPERATNASLLNVRLQAALNQLSPEQRETFLKKEMQGLKYEEIAEQEGCSVGTIKSRIFRARQLLMADLQDCI